MNDETDENTPQWRRTVEAFNKTMNELDSMRMQLRKDGAGPLDAAPGAAAGMSERDIVARADVQAKPSGDPKSASLEEARSPQIDKLERVLKVIRRVVGDRVPSDRERAALAEVDAELEALRQEWRDRQSQKE